MHWVCARGCRSYLGTLPFGIYLVNQLTEGIVAILPVALIGVVHGEFAPQAS